MRTVTYWLVVAVLLALTVGAFRLVVTHGLSALGVVGFVGMLVCLAVLLSYAISMRDRDRSSPPIAR